MKMSCLAKQKQETNKKINKKSERRGDNRKGKVKVETTQNFGFCT